VGDTKGAGCGLMLLALAILQFARRSKHSQKQSLLFIRLFSEVETASGPKIPRADRLITEVSNETG
jgi:hypothetical protein